MTTELIITFGSLRQSKEFLAFLNNDIFKTAHILEDRGDGYAKPVDELLLETLELIKTRNLPVKAFVSLGRATVIDGIPNIIECWQKIKQTFIPQLEKTQYIGPSYIAGKCIPDKWLATELFNLLELPVSKAKHLDLNNNAQSIFSFPFILKPTRFSGGGGMKYVENDSSFSIAKEKLKRLGENQAIITEFIQGMEVSVEILRLDGRVLVFPIGTKQFTDTSLSHAENKVRVYGYLKPIPNFVQDAIKIVEALDIKGLFSVEGIVHDKHSMNWKIIEAATRVSGNLPMEQASTNISAFRNIAKYLQGKELDMKLKSINVAVEISIYNHNNEQTVQAFLQLPWVKRSLLSDLSELKGSEVQKKRVSVGFMAGEGKDLRERCLILEKISGDNAIFNRIKSAIQELNDFFGDYVINPQLYDLNNYNSSSCDKERTLAG